MVEIDRKKFENDIIQSMEIMEAPGMRRFVDIMDKTNKFTGIILKKAEMENNFGGVYSQALKKITEFQFIDFESSPSQENFLEIFGETGG